MAVITVTPFFEKPGYTSSLLQFENNLLCVYPGFEVREGIISGLDLIYIQDQSHGETMCCLLCSDHSRLFFSNYQFEWIRSEVPRVGEAWESWATFYIFYF